MKPSVVNLLETVVMNNQRFPEEKFEFNLTPEEAKQMVDYINKEERDK